MKSIHLLHPALAWVIALLASAPVQAQQICSSASNPVAFGLYDPQSSAHLDNTGNITVTCQATVSLLIGYTVKLSAGSSGAYASRKMLSGANSLNYQVYTDSARTSVWGDGSSSTGFIADGYLLQVLTPVVKSYTVYGRVPGSQNAKAGSYLDTLTVLITY
ncbi:spore coat protein U domain-containing protein [Herbaspirillum sp. AP02]|uniref:Csu type fimbrial protein n=1 Tax=unclassified Herbaspirillum TaxID=2624150 RepID=UPI0015DA2FC2|nr:MULTISPECIES: spore coat U domain-containing protein [unclassified Herbaspirillum]MBG7617846.1 spore coat protein U domain-containing protein [Herbaspirillum sp. AP02]NZD70033.1 spore coat protein U domain-containing protein [Herbaspirillum sp. AP21]